MLHLTSRLRWLALLCIGVALAGCGSDAKTDPAKAVAKKLRPVTLALNWFPEMEHGGFYAAKAAGYFEEEGLDVKLIPGGPNVKVIQNVARGEAQFGVAVADQILLGRAQGADVVALMSPMQDSPRCILVHEETGFTKLSDLKNVTLAMRTGIAFSEFLKSQVKLENVKVVEYPGNVTQFLLDKNYAQQAYSFSEPFIAQQQGAKPRALMVSDLGYNPYTSVLFTSDSTLAKDEDLARKMTRASVRGWQKYLADAAPANELLRAANPEITIEALNFGQQAVKPLCLPNNAAPETLGKMTAERWQQLADQLIAIKLLEPGKVKVAEAYRLDMLP